MSSSLDRAVALLHIVCDAPRPLRFTEIVAAAGMPKSTVNRLLGALVAHDLIRSDDERRHYLPGFGLLTLAKQTWDGLDVRTAARGELEKLLARVGETLHLAVMSGHEITYLDKLESPQTIRLFSAVGKRGPLYCTGVGKAILAFLDDADRVATLDAIDRVQFTPNTLTDRDALLRALAEIRACGYAIDREEHEEGIRCIAAPIFNFRAQPVAGISITSTASRMSDSRLTEELPSLIVDTAQRISRTLGFLDVPSSQTGVPR